MIRVVFFDLGGTLIDDQKQPFAHAALALGTIAGFRTAAGKPLRSALVSDFTPVAPPLTAARIKPVFDEYLALLQATGLRLHFEPVARRVTLSTHAGVNKPAQAVFEKALQRLQVKATLDQCVLITENKGHVLAVRKTLGMQALRFGPAGERGVDFSDWSQAPALLAHLLGHAKPANVHAAIKAYLAAQDFEADEVVASGRAAEFQAKGSAWHAVPWPKQLPVQPGQPGLTHLHVALPCETRVRIGPRGALQVNLPAPEPAALAEACNFAISLAAHGQIEGAKGQVKLPTHATVAGQQGQQRLVRRRFSAF